MDHQFVNRSLLVLTLLAAAAAAADAASAADAAAAGADVTESKVSSYQQLTPY